ncbi:MAG: succinate--CoA ligase subunit beta, partial [Thermoplasmata archaeon]|nr:succinate--CoA ligase subunit beta [Thermoplasmata archaeon]
KAQALVGGRGKAGGIVKVSNREEAGNAVAHMMSTRLRGYEVASVLLEKMEQVTDEVYVAVTIDRAAHKLVMIGSHMGGVDVETASKEHPEAFHKIWLEPEQEVEPYMGRELAHRMGFKGKQMAAVGGIATKLYKAFKASDGKLCEINPIGVKADGSLVALDAVFNVDTDAFYRHPEFKEMGIESGRHEEGELTPNEEKAREAGFPYVDLDGDIGTFPGGAGFGIASIDLIHIYGGMAANFMDSGGAPSQEKLRAMLGLLLDDPKVKVIFGARFGGISRCDDWATAVVQFIHENEPKKPMIMRMTGNMEEEGRHILEEAKTNDPELFAKIKIYPYTTPIEEVVQEAIAVAKAEGGGV